MPEQPPTIETQESSEKAELLPYFPTDFERAKEGLKKFNEIFERSEILKKIAEKDKFFKDKLLFNATGLMPESGFYGGGGFEELDTDEDREELKRIYEQEFGFKTIDWQSSDQKHGHSVFNPSSVEKVIKNCPIPNLFPEEAKKNPMEWILNNPDEWVDYEDPKKTARFGIMSGYPPHGSAVFREYLSARDSFINNKLAEEEIDKYRDYVYADRHNREFPKEVEVKLQNELASGLVTAEQADLVKKFFTHKGLPLEYFGDGFTDEDEKYFGNVKVVLEKLKIEYNQT